MITARRGVLAALVIVAIVSTGCASRPHATADCPPEIVVPTDFAPQAPTVDFPGVPNFGVISADVWRGGRPTAAGIQTLTDAGVRTIIDLQLEGEAAPPPPGVRYIALPVSGWHADRVDIDAVLSAIDQCPKPVFVHCREGRDRTGLAIAAYRVDHGMSLRDAFRELEAFHVHPWWRAPIERRVALWIEQTRP